MEFEIRQINYGSAEYEESLRIRDEIFRKPWGLSIYDDDNSADAKDVLFAAFDGAEMVGMTFLQTENPQTARIRSVITIPRARGVGLGKKLMDKAEELAFEMGFHRLVLRARVSALGFYEKLGYRTVGEIYEYRRVPHVEMEKLIGGN